jgi:hypothetical protein
MKWHLSREKEKQGYGFFHLGPMSFKAQICSSPMADITVTTKSFPSANPSLICHHNNMKILFRTLNPNPKKIMQML